MTEPQLRIVDPSDRPLYPISATDRLDSHYFLQWNLKRWRGSDFRRHGYADPEVGFFGRELFDLAQDETPIGTLPKEDEALAFLLRLPISRWLELRARTVSPLHGWHEVICDNDQVRLAHPVVTEVAIAAMDSRKKNDAKNADDRMRKRLQTIAMHLRQNIPGASRLAENEEYLNKISDWVEARYPGGSATQKRITEALNDLSQRP
ncbi:hypothetical protein [Pseudooceanicola sp. MF1-13]|uniref:hypothetical protein n=1 Tax=Pseudooceanicola sp. MF1-13 TaxID=3379095 RepID=UPI0038921991